MKRVNNKRRIKKLIKQTITDILNPTLQIVSTSNGLPEYGSPLSAGMDIKADLWEIKEQFMKNAEIVRDADGTIANITIHPGGHCLIPTGIYTAFDSIYEIQVRPRSGNALKHRLTITNSPGTIDSESVKNSLKFIAA